MAGGFDVAGPGPARDQPTGPREVALKVLYAVEQRGDQAEVALNFFLRRFPLDKRDRALATELAYGAIRRQNTLDWVIAHRASRPPGRMPAWIRNVLRLGVYQLLYLDRVPSWAAVDESVRLARKYGHSGTARLVNAVLRAVSREPGIPELPDAGADPAGYLALVQSHPRWLVERWLRRYGLPSASRLCEFNNRPAPVVVRPNRLKASAGELRRSLEAEGVVCRETGLFPPGEGGLVLEGYDTLEGLKAYRQGWFLVQDEGAMVVSRVLGPEPGETVVDACSAPGGKATHLAELMGDRGRVLAVDVLDHRLAAVAGNCRRLGIKSVRTVCSDARHLGRLLGPVAHRVLADVPCSGTGALRRNPDARWRLLPERLPELVRREAELLRGAASCLAEGGVLVYSTCSMEPEENLEVVEAFRRENPAFVYEDLRPHLPPSLAGEPTAPAGYLQLLPHVHGTDGFFLARLRRRPRRRPRQGLPGGIPGHGENSNAGEVGACRPGRPRTRAG
ncbi:MAG: 16S rRNA (cytosine(967)-C(5))-methyltransferase RsmB [Acetobacteraceae bacterium]|nr:16S rRNA (cytosine(967)-C(5))-methyltransferase RsmB [Acetobacteraceae bacterium]